MRNYNVLRVVSITIVFNRMNHKNNVGLRHVLQLNLISQYVIFQILRGSSYALRPGCYLGCGCCLRCDCCGFRSTGRRRRLGRPSRCWLILRTSIRCCVWGFLGIRVLLGSPKVVTISPVGVSIGCFHHI